MIWNGGVERTWWSLTKALQQLHMWFGSDLLILDSTDERGSTKSSLVIMQKLKPMAKTWLSMGPSISRALLIMVPCSAVRSFFQLTTVLFCIRSMAKPFLLTHTTIDALPAISHPLWWLLFILKWMQCHGTTTLMHQRNLGAFAFRWRKTKDERRCCGFNWRVLFNIWKSLMGR